MKRPVCGHLGGVLKLGQIESMKALVGLQRRGKAAAECDEMCRAENFSGNLGLQRGKGAAADYEKKGG